MHGLTEIEKVPILYPRITDWLQKLDDSPQGDDGQQFVKYGLALEQNGYSHIFQIAEEDANGSGARDLVEMCKGMPLGIAKLLIKYAKADCQVIERKELNRLQMMKYGVPEYFN